MHQTATALENYVTALSSLTYHYRLVHPKSGEVKLGVYSTEQLLRSEKFFRAHNSQGFNIYCRPEGYQYVLLDDLVRDTLTALAGLKPCMIMETSPCNYQAWLILPELPPDRQTAKAICKELALRFGADIASAEPDHVGRLPGFTNRKEKHRLPDGQFPFVRLRRAQYRISTFYPSGGPVLQSHVADEQLKKPVIVHSKGSASEQDFGQACWLIRQGRADDYIFEYLIRNSPNLEQRKGQRHVDAYLHRTIREAHRRVGEV